MIDGFSLPDVLAIQEDQVTREGASAGVRDFGLHETGSFRFDRLDPWLRRHTETPREGA